MLFLAAETKRPRLPGDNAVIVFLVKAYDLHQNKSPLYGTLLFASRKGFQACFSVVETEGALP